MCQCVWTDGIKRGRPMDAAMFGERAQSCPHLIRLPDLLEHVLGSSLLVHILQTIATCEHMFACTHMQQHWIIIGPHRMKLAGLLSISLLDLLFICVFRHAQQIVVVRCRAHYDAKAPTATRASVRELAGDRWLDGRTMRDRVGGARLWRSMREGQMWVHSDCRLTMTTGREASTTQKCESQLLDPHTSWKMIIHDHEKHAMMLFWRATYPIIFLMSFFLRLMGRDRVCLIYRGLVGHGEIVSSKH